jgi:hypothetical protein
VFPFNGVIRINTDTLQAAVVIVGVYFVINNTIMVGKDAFRYSMISHTEYIKKSIFYFANFGVFWGVLEKILKNFLNSALRLYSKCHYICVVKVAFYRIFPNLRKSGAIFRSLKMVIPGKYII